jgi:hypothetical protein
MKAKGNEKSQAFGTTRKTSLAANMVMGLNVNYTPLAVVSRARKTTRINHCYR